MSNFSALYEGRLVRLGPLDHEKDPQVISRWTHDPLFHSVRTDFVRPLSVEAVRKQLDNIEKQMEETKNLFHFALRLRQDNRLVGLAKIYWIDFHNGTGEVDMGIGDIADRRRGYGSDALNLLLRFGFNDLNLHRIAAWISADNAAFLNMARKAGFIEEARRREASYHAGRYWDVLILGLLRHQWEKKS
jgi:RimJ/RimL family protein N-acetyltransferase